MVRLHAEPLVYGGPELAYIVCVHTQYIPSTYIVHVSLIDRLECTMEQTKKFYGTFVPAAFVPFRSNGVD